MIELTLYVSLMSMFLLSLTLFLTAIFEARERQQIMAEVDQQGIGIMQSITRTISRADSILTPARGEDADSLSLAMYDSAENPTVFSLDAARLMLAIGTSASVPLHNDQVSISSIVFRNTSPLDTPGSIQVIVTVASRAEPGGRTVFTYEKTFQASASLHRP